MNEKLSVRAKYSAEDYVRVLSYMQKQFSINKYGHIILGVIVFIAIFLFVFLLADDKKTLNYFAIFIISLLSALFFSGIIVLLNKFVNPLIIKRSISKQYESSPAMQAENSFTVSNEGIENSNSLTSGTVSWDAIVKAVETQTDFLFYTSDRYAQFVPKYVFASETDINLVRCITRAKLGEKAKF